MAPEPDPTITELLRQYEAALQPADLPEARKRRELELFRHHWEEELEEETVEGAPPTAVCHQIMAQDGRPSPALIDRLYRSALGDLTEPFPYLSWVFLGCYALAAALKVVGFQPLEFTSALVMSFTVYLCRRREARGGAALRLLGTIVSPEPPRQLPRRFRWLKPSLLPHFWQAGMKFWRALVVAAIGLTAYIVLSVFMGTAIVSGAWVINSVMPTCADPWQTAIRVFVSPLVMTWLVCKAIKTPQFNNYVFRQVVKLQHRFRWLVEA